MVILAITFAEPGCNISKTAVDILTEKFFYAAQNYGYKNLVLAGGVSANRGLRDKFQEECEKNGIDLTIPEIKYCTDNAAMIGAAAYQLYLKGRFSDVDLNAKASDKLN